jgi:hypothetical protein
MYISKFMRIEANTRTDKGKVIARYTGAVPEGEEQVGEILLRPVVGGA